MDQEIDAIRAVLESTSYFHDVAYVGSGSFGKVFRANLIQKGVPSGQVALKVLPRDLAENAHVQREILIHNKLMHPHIIQFKRLMLFQDYICIAMEYADQGSLHHDFTQVRKGQYSESEIRQLFQQLILAVDYCHRKGVADRDIKLENVLLRQDPTTGHRLLKLADFGYSKNVDQSVARTQVGTPGYMAPEILQDPCSPYDARAADMWSCGVLLFALLFKQYPFDDDPDAHPDQRIRALYEAATSRSYRNKIPAINSAPPACLQLMHQLLDPDPTTRARIHRDVLANAWFRQGLPEGYIAFNNHALADKRMGQPESRVIQILQEAIGHR